ncbi:hypothetical protein JCM6882_002542 [Rhodosporidiobolus microsporus]
MSSNGPASPKKPNRAFPWLEANGKPQLEDVARLIREGEAKRIIVMAGAGISTSAGIPDFRSPGTGLYDNLAKYQLPYPEAIFDIDYLSERPEAFYTLAKELYPGNFKPTTAHYFFKLLQDKKVLKGVWTQNIDTLERIAGITDDLIVEAHGSFAEAECLNCRRTYTQEEIKPRILSGEVVRCREKRCEGNREALVKPKIVFFGEGLPDRFFDRLPQFQSCDLLIVLGTSLSVGPFNTLISRVPSSCPRLLINLESVGEIEHPRDKEGFDFTNWGWEKAGIRDVRWLGQADEGVEALCRLVGEGWAGELGRLKEEGWREIEKGEYREKAGRELEEGSDEAAEGKREEVVEAVGEAADEAREKAAEQEADKDGAKKDQAEGEKVADTAVDELTKAVEGVELSAEKVVAEAERKDEAAEKL